MSELEGERRHLTVLFCDLVGSTEIASHLDPEEWREMVARYHNAATGAVEHFGGKVAQYLGDGVLAYFGYPTAHEDDGERAVQAGLAVLDAIAALNRQPRSGARPDLVARVGIDTGSVVVGESDNKRANVFGDVPNVASRVQNAAAPNTVLITAAVHHLVSGFFVVEDVGAQPLKGIGQPVQLYHVVRPSGVRGRLAAAGARGLTPFIAREDELRHLLSRWEQVREGEGQMMLVVGEAGIGKSRLVHRFREQISDTPHTWVDCAALALHQNTPFYTVTDMLQQSVRWRSDQSAEERLSGLEQSMMLAGLNLDEALPLIAPLMNLAVPAKYPPLEMTAERLRKRLLATIATWATGIARIQPMVIAVEDLHWADPSTLEVIQLLAEQGPTAPLFLVCTARPEFRPPWPLRAHHAQVTLNRLNAGNVREMVENLAHTAFPIDTIEALIKRSGGVPLFVEELTRAVVDSGEEKHATREIPATLHDSLMARLDRLGEAREIAQTAAVIGYEFSWELLSAVTGIANDKLDATLKKLSDAEVVFVQGIPPEANYRFRHALIQEAAYQSLLKSKRQLYHRQIAQILEERFSEIAAEQPQIPAYHYTEANLGQQAIPLWQLAGQKAVQRSANAEAVSHFGKAIELLGAIPESAERAQQELGLQLAQGTALIATRGFGSPEVGKVYARAREICQQAGEAPQLFPVLWGLWVFYTARAEHETAHELSKQCLHMAEATGDPGLLIEAHHAVGVTLTALGEFGPGLEHLEYVIEHHKPTRQDVFAFGQDPKVVCLSQAAWTLWVSGYPDQAMKRNEEAIALARELSHPYSLAAALGFGAIVPHFCRSAEKSLELAEAGVKLSTEREFAFWMAWNGVMHGSAMASGEQLAEGIGEIRESLDVFRARGAAVMVPYFLGLLAEAHSEAGQVREGLAVLAEAQAAVDASHERWWEPELYRLRGELTLKQSGENEPRSEDLKAAEEYFNQAISIAIQLNAKSLELRAAMSLSHLWLRQGKKAEAHRMLAGVHGWFKEGLETADLEASKRLLEQLAS